MLYPPVLYDLPLTFVFLWFGHVTQSKRLTTVEGELRVAQQDRDAAVSRCDHLAVQLEKCEARVESLAQAAQDDVAEDAKLIDRLQSKLREEESRREALQRDLTAAKEEVKARVRGGGWQCNHCVAVRTLRSSHAAVVNLLPNVLLLVPAVTECDCCMRSPPPPPTPV